MTLAIERADGSAIWVPETTIAVLERAALERPDFEALIADDVVLSYREYLAAVEALAARLAQAGGRGDSIAIILPNMASAAVAMFAVQRAGRVTAMLNPNYTAAELLPMLADAAPAAVVAMPAVLARLSTIAGNPLIVPVDGDAAFLASLEPAPARLPPPPQTHELAVLQFTGGTTGRAKGVELTHSAVAANIAQREAVLPTTFGDERVLCVMPMFHSFAAAMCVHLAAYAAGTLVIQPRYHPERVTEALAAHGITRLPAGPTVFNSLVAFDGLRREHARSLRCAYSGSAPLSGETLERWEELTGVPIYEGYGQSEAGPILTYFGPGMLAKRGSVGPPLPGTQLRIAGAAGPGETGEILARGPQIMRGYRSLPSETAQTLADGWLHTGDIGHLNEDGHLFISDRKKDMVLISGYNVFPREVDEALMRHPDVASAACVGVPDTYRGEQLVAFVTARQNRAVQPANLALYLEERLVRYKRPAAYHLLEALPLTPAGKIDKQALRAMAQTQNGRTRDVA